MAGNWNTPQKIGKFCLFDLRERVNKQKPPTGLNSEPMSDKAGWHLREGKHRRHRNESDDEEAAEEEERRLN